MTTVAVIQARMGSSRFPGKHLAPLAGKPMILHVINACNKSRRLDKVVVAISNHQSDDPLYHYLKSVCTNGCVWYRGSLTDPLERTYEAAREHGADVVVRITADCPLVDYRLIDSVLINKLGDVYRGQTNSPDGSDVEAFDFTALHLANLKASVREREHTTTWIRNQAKRGLFKATSVEGDERYNDVHYSVNTVEDLNLCEQILAITGENARWEDHVEAYRKLKV